MATITKRRGRIVIEWNKDAPTDLRYFHECVAVIADDSEDGGEKEVSVRIDNTGTRATFRGLTGQQIEDDWKAKTDSALQDLGSGAGGHSIVQDWGS
jgi:hypothetical protein